jgi:class 3 adenylate cyclase
MNIERMERGEPQFLTGIGVNPGSVAVGVLEGDGAGRHYVLIGDTVNVTSRLQAYTRSLGESAVILSHHTVTILGACSAEFHLETLGEQHFNGKSAPILIYRLREHSHHAAPFYL